MELSVVKIENPDELNFILGQSHFIKTVEDLYETLVMAVPGIKFGLAFCEASGPSLIRWAGTSEELIDLAKRNALALSAGHSFLIFLGPGFFPINILNGSRTSLKSAGSSVQQRTRSKSLSPKQTWVAVYWASSMDSGAKASKESRTSPGARTSCARSVTSCRESVFAACRIRVPGWRGIGRTA